MGLGQISHIPLREEEGSLVRPSTRRSPPYRARPQDGIAWITGASTGIGRALALHLVEQGFRVAVTARRADLLQDLESASRGRIVAFPGDVTNLASMREIVAAIDADLGPICLAVFNAGFYDLAAERALFDADAAWRTIEVNLGGVMRCLDPVLAAMLDRRRGQIAVVASLAGYGGIPGSAAYGAAKAGLISFAEAMRLTHAAQGITVQVINPGFVETAMTAPNNYPMPFMITAEQAATRINRGLASGGFEIAFPRRLVWTMKAAKLLPYRLRLPLMERATRRAQQH